MAKTRKEQLEGLLEAALTEQANILKQIEPLQAQYDELAEQSNEIDKVQRPIGNQLKALKAPLYDLSKEISGYNMALGKEYVPPQDPSEVGIVVGDDGGNPIEVPTPPEE